MPRTNDLSRHYSTQGGDMVTTSQTVAQFTSGPIPTPENLIAYNGAFIGAAEKIFNMADRQSIHRQKIEEKAIFSGAFRATLGVVCAALLSVLFLAGGVYCIINNHDYAGSAIIVSALASLVTTFIYGTNSQRNERSQKKAASDKLVKPQA